MIVEPLGESAFIIRELAQPAHLVAQRLNDNGMPGLLEAVPSYDTVGLYVDPELFNPYDLAASVESRSFEAPPEKTHIVPVCYQLGEDLEAAASALHLSVRELIELHTRVEFRCYAIGFTPAFPYLGYLPEKLRGLPRRPQPRVRVPAGSVAITGDQTGIYPSETPGGWWLIGRTPLRILDLEAAYFPIAAGDTVRFTAIAAEEFERLQGQLL